RAEVNASGREIVLKIADELEGALPPTAGRNIGFIGVSGSGQGPTDAVEFDVVVRRPFGMRQARSGRAQVSYSLDPMPNAQNLFALRRQEEMLTQTPPDESNPDQQGGDAAQSDAPTPPEALAAHIIDQVAGLRLRYLDPLSGEWTETWDTTVET